MANKVAQSSCRLVLGVFAGAVVVALSCILASADCYTDDDYYDPSQQGEQPTQQQQSDNSLAGEYKPAEHEEQQQPPEIDHQPLQPDQEQPSSSGEEQQEREEEEQLVDGQEPPPEQAEQSTGAGDFNQTVPLSGVHPCGWFRPRDKNARIAGGYPAAQSEFPSYVHLHIRYGYYKVVNCGGTIISEWLVLTAAHCMTDVGSDGGVKSITVYAGGVNWGSGTQYSARGICLPKPRLADYVNTDKDIAVIVMKQPFVFNDRVQPACLPALDVGRGYQAHVVGFGLTGKSPLSQRPARLQTMPVLRDNSCPFRLYPNAVCYKSNFYAYAGDACEGDSGGPVYAVIQGRMAIVAVVSSGVNTCRAGQSQAGVYMNVYKSDRLIRDIVAKCRLGSSFGRSDDNNDEDSTIMDLDDNSGEGSVAPVEPATESQEQQPATEEQVNPATATTTEEISPSAVVEENTIVDHDHSSTDESAHQESDHQQTPTR